MAKVFDMGKNLAEAVDLPLILPIGPPPKRPPDMIPPGFANTMEWMLSRLRVPKELILDDNVGSSYREHKILFRPVH